MFFLVLVIIGIFEAIRRRKIRALAAGQFPRLSPETFESWRTLQLKSINMFLWGTWGVGAIGLSIAFVFEPRNAGTELNILSVAACLILLGVSVLYDHRAKKLERQMLTATSKDYFQIAKSLANKADPNAKDGSGHTRLHLAAMKNQKDVVELLLANGALVNAKDNDGETPLHYAAFTGNKDLEELLLASHADVNAADNDGETPLHLAMEQHHEDVAELLRQHGGHE